MVLHLKSTLLLITCLFLVACSTGKKIISETQTVKEPSKDTIIKTVEIIKKTPDIKQPIAIHENSKIIEQFDHTLFDQLLKENVSKSGDINYNGFIDYKTVFKTYLTALSESLPKKDWTKHDKLAYWMNVYNAFTIKLIIDNYPTKSIKNIKNAWDSRFFKLGNKWYNLSDIEHKILRKMNDPRIHFGINCASYSCPKLHNKAFTANNVNTELDKLTRQFINDKNRNTISKNSIQLSKIFQWYAKDFKTDGSLIDYLNKYSDIVINPNAKKSFKKYDWSLNEAHNGH